MLEPPGEQDEASWLNAHISSQKPDILILDVRSDLATEALERWRSGGLFIATLDDPSDRRLETDLAFYPPVPQVRDFDWSGFTGELYIGWDWVVLRREFGIDKPVGKKKFPTPASAQHGGKRPCRFDT